MALSQIQCLDDNHVNWRLNESKPEFFYSEDQRLALEALVTGGREAFHAYVKEREVRPFLSEPELDRLCRSVEDYKPGSEHHKGDGAADGEDGTVSLQYWPDRSDVSIPDLDLGWPDSNSYRGVTRVNVYTQPPMDGQTHIKEVVRKTIAQAQKMIAIVMDVFTDVDIFKDLLDASFKRKVAVYIIIEQAAVQHFLNMCERASMHKGHLKNLRVRCSGGAEFHTRSAKKIEGSLSQRFMFVDGDRAVSGSYSFTWTASRLDRNLITVMTGQAVETFDKQFRELYLNSRGVSLSKIPLVDLPEPDPVPVPAPAPVPSVAVARKLINPKYALVETASKTSSDKASPKNSASQNPLPKPAKRQREVFEEPVKHPGLVGLLKAELISYLPTWPEPDPPSDVIGFINVRDTSKPVQVHLMRSQLFETSQAIRFKDPFTAPPEEPLPDKASPRSKDPDTPKTAPPNAQVKTQPETEGHPENHPAPEQADTLPAGPPAPSQTDNPDTETKPDPPPPQEESPPKPTAPLPEKNQVDGQSPVPPVPKPRTIQLVMTAADGPEPVQVSLVKKNEGHITGPNPVLTPPSLAQGTARETPSCDEYWEAPEEPPSSRPSASADLLSVPPRHDNDADSTKVMCGHSAKDKDEGSTASDEYYECSDSSGSIPREQLANGGTTGSGRAADRSTASDSLNVMARFSQSMLDLRPEKRAEPDPAEWNLLNVQSRFPGKAYQKMERSPARDTYNRAKVVIAKPGVFHRPPKSNTHVIGGHKYWQAKLYASERPQPVANRTGRSPSRHGSPYRAGGARTGVAHTHSPSPLRHHEAQTPLGIAFSKLASCRNIRGKIPAVLAPVSVGEKRLARGKKQM